MRFERYKKETTPMDRIRSFDVLFLVIILLFLLLFLIVEFDHDLLSILMVCVPGLVLIIAAEVSLRGLDLRKKKDWIELSPEGITLLSPVPGAKHRSFLTGKEPGYSSQVYRWEEISNIYIKPGGYRQQAGIAVMVGNKVVVIFQQYPCSLKYIQQYYHYDIYPGDGSFFDYVRRTNDYGQGEKTFVQDEKALLDVLFPCTIFILSSLFLFVLVIISSDLRNWFPGIAIFLILISEAVFMFRDAYREGIQTKIEINAVGITVHFPPPGPLSRFFLRLRKKERLSFVTYRWEDICHIFVYPGYGRRPGYIGIMVNDEVVFSFQPSDEKLNYIRIYYHAPIDQYYTANYDYLKWKKKK